MDDLRGVVKIVKEKNGNVTEHVKGGQPEEIDLNELVNAALDISIVDIEGDAPLAS